MTRWMMVTRVYETIRISRYRCVGLLADEPTRFSAAQFGNLEGCVVEEMQLITSGLSCPALPKYPIILVCYFP